MINTMTTICINATADNYAPAPFDNDTLIGDLRDWLRSNIRGHWTWEYEPRQIVPGKPHHWMLAFRFTNPEDATLFKLTWA